MVLKVFLMVLKVFLMVLKVFLMVLKVFLITLFRMELFVFFGLKLEVNKRR